MLEIVDKVLQRRQYYRDKQRAHRRKLAQESADEDDEIARLRATIADLQQQLPISALSATGSDGALSWHLVAGVFRANSWRSMANRRTLLEQTLANDVLTRNMRRFVSLNLQALPTRPRCIMWQPATLLAQPEARKLGKEWLTQRMYHHTDEALHRSFPADVSIDQEYAHYDTTVSDDGSITCFEAVQNIWP
ncbi:hypothetical protein As57867_022256, partial [Aphanomyces stellatus]